MPTRLHWLKPWKECTAERLSEGVGVQDGLKAINVQPIGWT
jgi:hypothetical protein